MANQIVGLEGVSGRELAVELAQGAKFVVYQYCISIVVMTFLRSSKIHFIRAGESAVKPGLKYSILSLLLGWWGIPWGVIRTPQALINNFRGGKDVTDDVVSSVRRAAESPE